MSKKKTSTKKEQKSGLKLKVTQFGSKIGREDSQERTLIGLGLNKTNRTRILEDNPCIRGMIAKVAHLVKFEEIK